MQGGLSRRHACSRFRAVGSGTYAVFGQPTMSTTSVSKETSTIAERARMRLSFAGRALVATISLVVIRLVRRPAELRCLRCEVGIVRVVGDSGIIGAAVEIGAGQEKGRTPVEAEEEEGRREETECSMSRAMADQSSTNDESSSRRGGGTTGAAVCWRGAMSLERKVVSELERRC